MGLQPHQKFFQIFFSTNMVARGAQSFCILESATDPLIEQWLKFSSQFSPDMRWTNLVNPIIIVVYRSAGPDKSADFVMNCY